MGIYFDKEDFIGDIRFLFGGDLSLFDMFTFPIVVPLILLCSIKTR